jgi:hypothetical protein
LLPLFFSGGGVFKPELIGATNSFGDAVTTLAVTKPAGATQGQLGLVFLSANDSTGVITPPAGWALVAGSTQTIATPQGQKVYLYQYILGASEPSGWTFTSTVSTQLNAICHIYRDAQAIDVLTAAVSSAANNSPVTVAFPSITPALSNETVVLFAALDPTVAGITTKWTPPTQFIERAKQDWLNPPNGHVWSADNVKTGATGVMNATVVTSANSVGWLALSVALTTKVVSGVTGTYSGSQTQTFSANGSASAPTITGAFIGSQQQTFSAGGTATPPLISGSFTGAQQQTFSATGAFTPQAISGSFAGNQQQTFSAVGTFTPVGITGDYTGSQAQSFSASGTFSNPAITGAYSGSQVQSFSASGTAVPPAITGAYTGGQTQTFSAVGGSIAPITGSFTGSQRQTFTGNGTFTPAAISGTYAGSQRQTFSATGTAIPPAISGTYSGGQQQTFNASGGAISPVTGAYTGSQVQSFSGSGGEAVPVTGTYTGGQTQSFAGAGQHGSTEQPSGGDGGSIQSRPSLFKLNIPSKSAVEKQREAFVRRLVGKAGRREKLYYSIAAKEAKKLTGANEVSKQQVIARIQSLFDQTYGLYLLNGIDESRQIAYDKFVANLESLMYAEFIRNEDDDLFMLAIASSL